METIAPPRVADNQINIRQSQDCLFYWLKIYAELMGNRKSAGIKSLADNKLTSKMTAKPFMAPAFEHKKREINEIISKKIREALRI